MVLVTVGIDALDSDLVDSEKHPHLTLAGSDEIDTIPSAKGPPSTHEIWPTLITGLPPEKHGLEIDSGPAWGSPVLDVASGIAGTFVPRYVRTQLGAWLLNNTAVDAFRAPASYYERNGIRTVFDGRDAKAIGIPNYVTDPDESDREHELRRQMSGLFERDRSEQSGHTSSDPAELYERCLEMAMIRIARTRRAFRSNRFELVFSYTSALDLIGHVAYEQPALQQRAYVELNEFVGELRSDLGEDDVLVLVSDHGLQDGIHTNVAMISSTDESITAAVNSVTDLYGVLADRLDHGTHQPTKPGEQSDEAVDLASGHVRQHLDDLGYL